MAMIIQIPDIVFTNPNLPNIKAALETQTAGDTEAMAHYIMGLDARMIDTSGHGRNLEKVGTPVENSVSSVVDKSNFYQMPMSNPRECTVILVMKGDGIALSPSFGNWNHYDKTGLSVYLQDGAFAVMAYNENGVTSGGETQVTTVKPTEFTFLSATFDANKLFMYCPREGVEKTIDRSGVPQSVGSGNLRIGNLPSVAWPGQTDVAEVLVFDRVLSKQQLQQKYAESVGRLINFGIVGI